MSSENVTSIRPALDGEQRRQSQWKGLLSKRAARFEPSFKDGGISETKDGLYSVGEGASALSQADRQAFTVIAVHRSGKKRKLRRDIARIKERTLGEASVQNIIGELDRSFPGFMGVNLTKLSNTSHFIERILSRSLSPKAFNFKI